MRRSDLNAAATTPAATPAAAEPDVPPQDGTLCPFAATPPIDAPRTDLGPQRSGQLHRPFDTIHRAAVSADDARTALECFKVAMRRYAPVQKGRAGLPWAGQWQCGGCGQTVAGEAWQRRSAR